MIRENWKKNLSFRNGKYNYWNKRFSDRLNSILDKIREN